MVSRALPRPAAAPAVLALYVRAGGILFAIDVTCVARIVAAPDLGGTTRGPDGALAQIQVDDRWLPAVDLLALFGLEGPTRAVVLVHVGARVIALHVGACLKVAPRPALTPLPPGLFRRRAGGVLGAFVAAAVPGGIDGELLGLGLDLGGALTADEHAALYRAPAGGPA